MIAKSPCQHCGTNIEFDVEHANSFVGCPACSQQTRLIIPIQPKNLDAPPRDELENMIFAGYITSVLLPVIGFIVGIILLNKNRIGHGIGCIVTSILCSLIWAFAFVIISQPSEAEKQRNFQEMTTPHESYVPSQKPPQSNHMFVQVTRLK